MKKLSIEGRVECGLEALVQGKTWAFVTVLDPKDRGYVLGAAVANEQGYYPIPHHWAHAEFHEQQAFDAHADELNAAMGLDPRAAAKIVGSSMFNAVL